MSADLFAEFGNSFSSQSQLKPEPQTQPSNSGGQPLANRQHQHQQAPAYDPFAVFEAQKPQPQPSQPHQTSQWPTVQPQPAVSVDSIWGDLSSLSGPPTRPALSPPTQGPEEDDWGDFEIAASNPVSPTQPAQVSSGAPAPAPTAAQPPRRTRAVRASTIDMMTNRLVDLEDSLHQIPGPSWIKPTPAPDTQAASIPSEPRRKPVRSNTEDFFDTSVASANEHEPNPQPRPSKQPNPNVLFDAEDFELSGGEDDDDDEFGDFEDADPAATSEPVAAANPTTKSDSFGDLLSLDFGGAPSVPSHSIAMSGSNRRAPPPSQLKPHMGTLSPIIGGLSPTSPYPQAPKSPSYAQRNPFPGLGLSTEPPQKEQRKEDKSPDTAWPTFGQASANPVSKTRSDKQAKVEFKADDEGGFGDWGTFEDLPLPNPNLATNTGRSQPNVDSETSWDWDPEPEISTVASSTAPPAFPVPNPTMSSPDASPGPPPTNIPPPSILLPLLPQLLRLPISTLFKSSNRLSPAARSALLSHPQTVKFLRGHLALATVTAHILAGRKYRWNRDKLLAQKMSVSAAGGKGMKLAGVDKAESLREAREAAEVAEAWKEVVGPLKSAVAGANVALDKGKQLRVPEIAIVMPVAPLKGGLTAPKACIVCGLRREERVSKVDVAVEDSFGEWWVEHWGHRTCRNFWVEQEKKLRSR